MYLVDYLHQHGIGVILDWVPSHSLPTGMGWPISTVTQSVRARRLAQRLFIPTGTPTSSITGATRSAAFLLSSAMIWLDKYHADGFIVEAVAFPCDAWTNS